MRIARMLLCAASFVAALGVPARAADVLAAGSSSDLTLGANWGPYERYGGSSFRWVDNDAEIDVRGTGGLARIAIACEGGPSLGTASFPLRVLDAGRRQVDHVACSGRAHPGEMILPANRGVTRYLLHADGGGKRLAGEPRILNFRVFSLDEQGAAAAPRDIADPASGLGFGAGWYPVERFNGRTFRWMSNDAHLYVRSSRPPAGMLRMLVEVGPSVGSTRAALTVRDRAARTIARTVITRSGVVAIPLSGAPDESELVFSVASANLRVPHDARSLNLRVFSAAVAH